MTDTNDLTLGEYEKEVHNVLSDQHDNGLISNSLYYVLKGEHTYKYVYKEIIIPAYESGSNPSECVAHMRKLFKA